MSISLDGVLFCIFIFSELHKPMCRLCEWFAASHSLSSRKPNIFFFSLIFVVYYRPLVIIYTL